jgi:hypothetical protein
MLTLRALVRSTRFEQALCGMIKVEDPMPAIYFARHLKGFRYVVRAHIEGGHRDVGCSRVESTLDGLMLTRGHALERDDTPRRSLAQLLIEANRLEVFVDGDSKPGLRFELEVSEPLDLPLLLDSASDEIALDRVLFRKVRLVARTAAPFPEEIHHL